MTVRTDAQSPSLSSVGSSDGGSDTGALIKRLAALSAVDDDYWAFEDKRERDYTHALFQYPAMMVPRVQRELLDELLLACPTGNTVVDPFVGSGTVMTEAMLRGCGFVGFDINPLAILVCKAKSDCFDSELLDSRLSRVVKRASADSARSVAASFPGRDKWLNWRARVELSRLKRAIEREPNLSARRFAWVALAETVRLSSNSRTSTVKLHMRPQAELTARRSLSPLEMFRSVAARNVASLRDEQRLLTERGLVTAGRYSRTVRLSTSDIGAVSSIARRASILMTSPPYGDNQTTVTYGQHSFLPLQWIQLDDVDEHADQGILSTTHELDHRSLGGSLKDALERAEGPRQRSASLNSVICSLERTSAKKARTREDGAKRVAAFYSDLDDTLTPILNLVKPGGFVVWTVGERRVNGRVIPMGDILVELLGKRVTPLTMLERRIPQKQKRMAARNNIADTMSRETILVMQKPTRPEGV